MKIVALILLLFVGCTKEVHPIHPALIIFKAKGIRYADSGFIKQRRNGVEVTIYEAGQPLMKLILAKRVCLNGSCMSYEQFNSRFLSPYYPAKLLQHIFLRRPIFHQRNLIKNSQGFIQQMATPHLDIIYTVQGNRLIFKDRKNHILIKIKELHG